MITPIIVFTFGSGAFAGLMVGAILSRRRGTADADTVFGTAAMSVGFFAIAVCLVFAST